MSNIDSATVDSLKVLDPEWPIREVDILRRYLEVRFGSILLQKPVEGCVAQ